METNDHDLLIELNTKVGILISQQTEFIRNNNIAITTLSERVSALETKDSRDSEKVQAISKDVQRSLDNHERIKTLEAAMESFKEDVSALTSKSNLWDIVNGVGIAIATIVGYLK